jgi:TPM domain
MPNGLAVCPPLSDWAVQSGRVTDLRWAQRRAILAFSQLNFLSVHFKKIYMSYKRAIYIFSALMCFSLTTSSVHAQQTPAKRKPPLPAKVLAEPAPPPTPAAEMLVKAPSTPVFDQTGDLTIEVPEPVMASSQAVSLREQLQQFKARHSEPIAVLLMPELHRGWESMDEYAPQITKKWSVGQAEAGTGLLVVVAFGKRGTQAALSFAPSLFVRLSEQVREQMMQDFLADLRAAQLAAGLSKLIVSLDLHLTTQAAQQAPAPSQ